jgi:N-acetylglucosaminyldiphosphoundecaprenol N-acetyl-beta-D-mannosaminyltransferase
MTVPPRVDVIGSLVSACTLQGALDQVERGLEEGGGGYVCFTNVHAVVEGRRNKELQQVTNRSFLSVADGKPVYWVGRAKGARGIGHSPGPDFLHAAVRRFATQGHYFYGSTPEVLALLRSELRRCQPDLQICGMYSPPFRRLSAEDLEQHYADIRASGARFLWVGLGAPKQELWMAEAARHLPGIFLFGVGAAFDFHAGTLKRAPVGWGKLGLEWLYRLLQEPRRLWKRYLVTNSLFLAYVLRDALGFGAPGNKG